MAYHSVWQIIGFWHYLIPFGYSIEKKMTLTNTNLQWLRKVWLWSDQYHLCFDNRVIYTLILGDVCHDCHECHFKSCRKLIKSISNVMYVRSSLVSFRILLQNEIENEVMKKKKVLLYSLEWQFTFCLLFYTVFFFILE